MYAMITIRKGEKAEANKKLQGYMGVVHEMEGEDLWSGSPTVTMMYGVETLADSTTIVACF